MLIEINELEAVYIATYLNQAIEEVKENKEAVPELKTIFMENRVPLFNRIVKEFDLYEVFELQTLE